MKMYQNLNRVLNRFFVYAKPHMEKKQLNTHLLSG